MKYIYFLIIAICVLLVPQTSSANSNLYAEVKVDARHVEAATKRPFKLVFGHQSWTVSPDVVKTWFKSSKADDGSTLIQLRIDRIYHYLNVHVSPKINTLGKPSRFVVRNGEILLVGPGRKGEIVDGGRTSLSIRNGLQWNRDWAIVYTQEHRPKLFSVDDFKRLRFPHHLGRGESNFTGSPNNRVHNINVAMKRYDGVVIFPGDEFSFNDHLGAVTAQNGYLPELVIKGNQTTPEYGGGICQVSTTVFRAAMQSGLKITSRRNHSYPVSYYGTPGYDATVYAPYTDFRFKNDTDKPIYITTRIEGTKPIFDFWGTSDGREVNVIGPYVTSRRSDGSLTAAVAQIVKKNGKSIREQNFVSHYQPADKFPTVTQSYR